MKILKYFTLVFVTSFFFYGCGSDVSIENDAETFSKKDNLNDCVSENFSTLITEVEKSIIGFYKCESVNLFYKELSIDEEKETKAEFEKLINDYSTSSNDTAVLKKDFVFDNLADCKSNITENNYGKCAFYTSMICYSTDMTIQYIRLFQIGVSERFDFLIKQSSSGIKVLAFG